MSTPRPFFVAAHRHSQDSAEQPTDHDHTKQHRRRSTMSYAPIDALPDTPSTPDTVFRDHPPSAFPFQAYPGNPDPGTRIPSFAYLSRRSSTDSLNPVYHPVPTLTHSNSDLSRPLAPFMSDSTNIYRNSAARSFLASDPAIPRTNSGTFRSPFLSPASRPTSSVWSPPSHVLPSTPGVPSSPSASTAVLPKSKPPLPSTRLPTKLEKQDKPWLDKKDRRMRASWWITLLTMLLGVAGGALLCWSGWGTVPILKDSQLCSVLDDDFNSLDLDGTWSLDIELGGFGNGEFQMTTSSQNNIYTQNSQLYIVPTLTSDTLGRDAILNGGNYTLQDCTTTNKTACSVSSSTSRGTVINPVMSARLNTKGKKNIQYGKIEVRAKLPRGDWLWPAIWLLPEDDAYGAWPLSGEIDIMEARGNMPSYPAQGNNFVRSSLNYGPLPSLIHTIFGWFSSKRSTFAEGFHTYALEWDSNFMRFYTDTRLNKMLDLRTRNSKESFWTTGGFPATAQNGSTQVVVQDVWSSGSNSAPFDKPFYLILDLAAGGTSGWFPDNVGNKPWFDASATAMRDFAANQDTWWGTWPQSVDDRAFRIDYVKMWSLC